MTPDDKITVALMNHIPKFVPDIEVRHKDGSRLHHWIGKALALVGNVTYSGYWTTFGKTAWAPIGTPPFDESDVRTLWHEGQHMQEGWWMKPLYLFPQILVLPAILLALLVSPWFWLGLLFLLPLPAPFRLYYELQAECVNILMRKAAGEWSGPDDYDMSEQLEEFTGPTYYYACPSRRVVRWLLRRQLTRLTRWDRMTRYERAAYNFVRETGASDEG